MKISINDEREAITVEDYDPPYPPHPPNSNQAYIWINPTSRLGYIYDEERGAWVAPCGDGGFFDIIEVDYTHNVEDAYNRAMSII